MAAVVHATDPGEGELHEMGANAILLIKATSEDTDGRFFLSESTIEPGFPGSAAPMRTTSWWTCSTCWRERSR